MKKRYLCIFADGSLALVAAFNGDDRQSVANGDLHIVDMETGMELCEEGKDWIEIDEMGD